MRILIPTDFSPASDYPIEFVLALLGHTQEFFQIILLSTYLVDEVCPLEVITANDRLKFEARRRLEAQRQRFPEAPIEIETRLGSLSNVIHTILKKEKVNLIVMSHQNRDCLLRVTQLTQDLRCPLLLLNP
jgi:nucleotide-binding universal stress UspA family protein